MKYILALDQSTSASKAFLVDGRGEIVRRASLPHRQYYPGDGLAEHDPEEIYRNVMTVLDQAAGDTPLSEIAALAISNQRETVVLWDRRTGKSVCPAIVWQDVRGRDVCARLAGQAEQILRTTGLGLSPYYPASKVAHLLENRPDLLEMARGGDLAMGTIESYLIYRITGRHVTDVSNASRTQLMNLKTLAWDDDMIRIFGLERSMLAPEILPTDGEFGFWKGVPITGVLGDSHATLFGQGCVHPGDTKVSYGTGSSVMMNMGQTPAICPDGSLTTAVAFHYGGRVHYQTEGNITCSCDTLVWLCREMAWFRDEAEIEAMAATVPDAGGVQLVPALSGLGAPYFDGDARGVLCGLSRGSTRAHVARAALEGIAQRCDDVTEAMAAFCGSAPALLAADGGGAKNALMMQAQADLAGCRVRCAGHAELSALGAAYMAGLKTGLYASLEEIPARQAAGREYVPRMAPEKREAMRRAWKLAVARAQLK